MDKFHQSLKHLIILNQFSGESRAELQGNDASRRSSDASVVLVTLFFLFAVTVVGLMPTATTMSTFQHLGADNSQSSSEIEQVTIGGYWKLSCHIKGNYKFAVEKYDVPSVKETPSIRYFVIISLLLGFFVNKMAFDCLCNVVTVVQFK